MYAHLIGISCHVKQGSIMCIKFNVGPHVCCLLYEYELLLSYVMHECKHYNIRFCDNESSLLSYIVRFGSLRITINLMILKCVCWWWIWTVTNGIRDRHWAVCQRGCRAPMEVDCEVPRRLEGGEKHCLIGCGNLFPVDAF